MNSVANSPTATKSNAQAWDKVKELALDYLYETQGETVDDLRQEYHREVNRMGVAASKVSRDKALQSLDGLLDASRMINASLPGIKKLNREVICQIDEESAREVAYWAIRQRLQLG